MSLPYAKPTFVDGDYTVATACGLPVFSSKIPATTAEYEFKQDFIQFKNNWTATAQGTAHPDYPTFYLVSEGDRQDQLGGVVRWTRTYAAVPASYSEYETFAYSFIGTAGSTGVNVPTIQGRSRVSWTVNSRVQNDFFFVPSTVLDPILNVIDTIVVPGDIPKILAMQYVSQTTFDGALFGGTFYAVDTINPAASTSPTYPTTEQYQTMIGDALTNGWKSTPTIITLFPTNTIGGTAPNLSGHYAGSIDTAHSTLGGQIPVEDSRITRWNGNVWLRQTRYVLAR